MRIRASLLALAASVLVTAGCGGSGTPARSIVLFSGQHLALTRAFVAAFEKQTGIQVHVRSDDGVVLADQILQDGRSSPADVFLTENSPELMALEERGLLARLPGATLATVPAVSRSPSGAWVGVALRVSALVCGAGQTAPRTILDLAEPAWHGRIAVAQLDSDFPPVVGAVIADVGVPRTTAWLAGLRRNARTYQDEEAVVSAVDRGDVACGIANQYYWYRLRLEQGAAAMHSALHFFPAADPGSVVNVSGVGVLASSRVRADAERFVAFLVSAEGQKLIAHGDDFEYPARPRVAASADLQPLARLPHARLSAAALGDDREAAKLIADAGFGA